MAHDVNPLAHFAPKILRHPKSHARRLTYLSPGNVRNHTYGFWRSVAKATLGCRISTRSRSFASRIGALQKVLTVWADLVCNRARQSCWTEIVHNHPSSI